MSLIGPTSNLIEYLLPIMSRYNVAAYMCGHDHSLQHLQVSGVPVDFYLTGAAHVIDLSTAHEHDVPQGSLKFHWPKNCTRFIQLCHCDLLFNSI